MGKDFSSMEDSNRSGNPSIHQVSGPRRRQVLQGGLGAAVAGLLAPLAGSLSGCATTSATTTTGATTAAQPALPRGAIGFASVPVSTADSVAVPPGYAAEAIAAWGEPVGIAGAMPVFREDAGNSAGEQALQMGMHHDGIHYYPLEGSSRGLLVMNHEYVDEGLLFPDGMANWSAEKVRKSQAAHGVAVIEVAEQNGRWGLVRPSRHARRITASTPVRLAGPAAGHALMKTAADPEGQRVLGTFNNCGSGVTPWGTYLSCEENFVNYFHGPKQPDAHGKRWGLRENGGGYRWHEHDERFDATKHPNEFNRFGWIVEIDPMDPTSTPVKRTALGRAAHEGATVGLTQDGRAVVYMGEDSRFEYIYKFVSRDAVKPGGAQANATLLDHGTLYVARFDADGTGRWLALRHGEGPLSAANGFADQGEVLVKTRQASDLLGATKMDRPEWIAFDPQTRDIYCTLTNNVSRGAASQPGVDAANPRAENTMGHIIRWRDKGDVDSQSFRWSHFVLAGDPANARADAQGNVKGDAFGCPDGLWVDGRGVLWVQTDMSTSAMGKGDLARLGNNAMLAATPPPARSAAS